MCATKSRTALQKIRAVNTNFSALPAPLAFSSAKHPKSLQSQLLLSTRAAYWKASLSYLELNQLLNTPGFSIPLSIPIKD